MNFIEKEGKEEVGKLYRFTQEEIDSLVKKFMKEQIGLDLNMWVACSGADYDVIVDWDMGDIEAFEIAAGEEKLNKIDEWGLHPEELFNNRNYIFQAMFKTDNIGYRYDTEFEEPFYEFIIGKPENLNIIRDVSNLTHSFTQKFDDYIEVSVGAKLLSEVVKHFGLIEMKYDITVQFHNDGNTDVVLYDWDNEQHVDQAIFVEDVKKEIIAFAEQFKDKYKK